MGYRCAAYLSEGWGRGSSFTSLSLSWRKCWLGGSVQRNTKDRTEEDSTVSTQTRYHPCVCVMVIIGEVPGHLQRNAEVPWSKALNAQIGYCNELVTCSGVSLLLPLCRLMHPHPAGKGEKKQKKENTSATPAFNCDVWRVQTWHEQIFETYKKPPGKGQVWTAELVITGVRAETPIPLRNIAKQWDNGQLVLNAIVNNICNRICNAFVIRDTAFPVKLKTALSENKSLHLMHVIKQLQEKFSMWSSTLFS